MTSGDDNSKNNNNIIELVESNILRRGNKPILNIRVDNDNGDNGKMINDNFAFDKSDATQIGYSFSTRYK